eukprot:GGOE01000294.1.p1 GENE.GGOE01000294.1~~GGOE01000294.1.p1  ORF type:complete len:744 (+),score=149.72 GGOE01000294.1:32-2263(+)
MVFEKTMQTMGKIGHHLGALKSPSGERVVLQALHSDPCSPTSPASWEPVALDSPSSPLLNQDGLPKFASIEPHHIEPAIMHLLTSLQTDFADLETRASQVPAADVYADVVERLEVVRDPLQYAWSAVTHLLTVRSSRELREAHEDMQPLVIRAQQKIGQSRVIHGALKRLAADHAAWGLLDRAQQRVVTCLLRQMRCAGIRLPAQERKTYNGMALELAELRTKFDHHVLDSTNAFALLLTSPQEVKGLPHTVRALAAQMAASRGHGGASAKLGPWLLTLDAPLYVPAMQYLEDRSLRETLMRAFVTRASAPPHDNRPVIHRMLTLRRQMAQMIGFTTFAEMSLASKMAKMVEHVDALSDRLFEACRGPAERELAAIRSFADAHGLDGELEPWDVSYWSERQREALYGFREDDLTPYFSLPRVLEGLFQLCNRLFGITIQAADGEVEVWHTDVRFFHVFEGDAHVASFYLDPYARPEEKKEGAWMESCLGASKVLGRKPVAHVFCNGTPPLGTAPSLLTFYDVQCVFHELGHALQHMLTRVHHGDAAGLNNVEWDAIELPSQFMENWCYDPATLQSFARHYLTDEPLPDSLLHGLLSSRNYNMALETLWQVYKGQIDMTLHHRYNPLDPSAGSPTDVVRRLASRYMVLPVLPEDHFFCAWDHIWSSEYAAGFYSYKWAEVMSADAFAAFEEVGLDDEVAVREVGLRYRDTILAHGGGLPAAEVFRQFRGRDPVMDHLLRHLGLE